MFPPKEIQEKWAELLNAPLDRWCDAIDKWAEEKGWNETYDEAMTGQHIALMHSELSEALEAWRNRTSNVDIVGGKPEGIAVELADCVIRIMHWFARRGISLEQVVATKMAYNDTRTHKHGNKRA